MISDKWMERYLQDWRFGIVKPYLKGDVLDFGGNRGELQKFVEGDYLCVNYDHSPMAGRKFDTIVSLAVIEHLEVEEVYDIVGRFRSMLNNGGRMCFTTPAESAHPLLAMLAALGITDKDNLDEHKRYWDEVDLRNLAVATGFRMVEYRTFQFGLNQFVLFEPEEWAAEGVRYEEII